MYKPNDANLEDEIRRLTRMVQMAADGVNFAVPEDIPSSPLLHDLYSELVRLINENKRLQWHTTEERAFFQRVFDELPVEVVIFDQHLKYRYINPVAVVDEEVRQWMIGKTDLEYCRYRNQTEEFTRQRQELYASTIANRETYSIFQSSKDRNGNMRHYIRQLSPVFFESGELEMLIGYGVEVTEVKEKEEELARKNQELQKTSTELDQFVYRASHDLRSPVVSILGLLNLAGMEDASPTLQRYIGHIRSRAHKLDGVIRDIVNFSQNSRQAVKLEVVDPHHQIQAALGKLPENYQDHSVRIIEEIDASSRWHTDPFRTQLLLTQLFTNAIKFQRPESGADGFVKVQVQVTDTEARIHVEDNGIGIPEDQQQHIFELFFRGTYKGDGSGIGLYIVREVLDRIGGRIEMRSREGEGSRFSIFLPNHQPEASPVN